MPRKRDDYTKYQLQCLLETKQNDMLEHLCSSSSQFWKDLVHTEHLKMTPKALYTFARKELAGMLQKENQSSGESEESDSFSVSVESDFDSEESFLLHILRKDWANIRPTLNIKTKRMCLANGWTETMHRLITENIPNQHCTWAFQYHVITPFGQHYLTFSAKCSDKSCARTMKGFSTAYDDVEGVTLKLLIKGKSSNHTQNKKRKLTGAKRNEIGTILSAGKHCVINYIN